MILLFIHISTRVWLFPPPYVPLLPCMSFDSESWNLSWFSAFALELFLILRLFTLYNSTLFNLFLNNPTAGFVYTIFVSLFCRLVAPYDHMMATQILNIFYYSLFYFYFVVFAFFFFFMYLLTEAPFFGEECFLSMESIDSAEKGYSQRRHQILVRHVCTEESHTYKAKKIWIFPPNPMGLYILNSQAQGQILF